MHPYSSLCDGFQVSTVFNTRMDLSTKRETVLHFFASLQKSFPDLSEFENRGTDEFSLEEPTDGASHRWVSLEPRRLSAGLGNPPSLEEADATLERILELAPYHLDLSPLDCQTLDVTYTFEFDYTGNHDEVVAEALMPDSPLEGLLQVPGSRVLKYEPSLTMTLDERCKLQCRLDVETRSTPELRASRYGRASISIYFAVRQYWDRQPFATFTESYRNQRRICQELVDGYVLPAVVQPLAATIAAR